MSAIDPILTKVTSTLGTMTGEQNKLTAAVIEMVNKYPGGIGGFVQAFKDKGLGAIVSSWVGTGANQAITPSQITNVLGEPRIKELAGQTKMDVSAVTSQLVKILPVVVDKLTPSGAIEAAVK